MDKEFQRRIREYNNGKRRGNNKKFLEGHLDKRFVLIDDDSSRLIRRREYIESTRFVDAQKRISDSAVFRELFEAAKNRTSHYVTYIDDLISPKDKSQPYYPKYVSCLVKTIPCPEANKMTIYGEVVGSRLANALGVDTVYNIAVNLQEKDDPYAKCFEEEHKKYDTIVSVDYVKTGYKTKTLKEMGVEFELDTPLEKIVIQLHAMLSKFYSKSGRKWDNNKINKFIRDFVKQWIYRSLIVEDLDLSCENCGVLIGKDDIIMAPAHDMEFIFHGWRYTNGYKQDVKTNIDFVRKSFPDVLDELMTNCELVDKSGELDYILDETLDVPLHLYIFTKERVHDRFRKLNNYWKYSAFETPEDVAESQGKN